MYLLIDWCYCLTRHLWWRLKDNCFGTCCSFHSMCLFYASRWQKPMRAVFSWIGRPRWMNVQGTYRFLTIDDNANAFLAAKSVRVWEDIIRMESLARSSNVLLETDRSHSSYLHVCNFYICCYYYIFWIAVFFSSFQSYSYESIGCLDSRDLSFPIKRFQVSQLYKLYGFHMLSLFALFLLHIVYRFYFFFPLACCLSSTLYLLPFIQFIIICHVWSKNGMRRKRNKIHPADSIWISWKAIELHVRLAR